jgi:NADH-quinone oxidoreductase subunit N
MNLDNPIAEAWFLIDIYFLKLTEIHQLWPALIILLAMGMILFAALTLERAVARLLMGVIVGFCLVASTLTAFNYYNDPEVFFLPSGLLGGCVVFDRVALFLNMLLPLSMLGVLILAQDLRKGRRWDGPVYLCAMLGSLAGLIFMASTWHLIFFALAMELANLPIYVLAAFDRRDDRAAKDATRLAIQGLTASAIMIYGISLLFGQTGSFEFQKIALRLSLGGIDPAEIFALACLLVGITFKIGLVPFHVAFAGLFRSAGADLAAWFCTASIAAGLVALIRFFHILTWFASDAFNQQMVLVLVIIALATMTLANFAAFRQTRLKKLLAWSALAHAGYMLLGVLIWNSTAGIAAVMAYLLVLALMNMGAFTVAALVEGQTGSDELRQFTGLWSRNRYLALGLTLCLLSLIGLPPLAGFTVKWNLLAVIWRGGQTVGAVVMGLNIIISLFYYLRVVRSLYWPTVNHGKIAAPPLPALLLGFCSIGLVGLFFYREAFLRFAAGMLFGFFG